MVVFTLKKNLQSFLNYLKERNFQIGFVPTMGALHEGHLTLVKKSMEENNATVVSIFVNPTQFDNQNDLKYYPRTLEKDLFLLENLDKDMIVYIPVAEDLYGGPVRAKAYDHGGLDRVMEGAYRPGHFDGVATVVELLFDAVRPHRAYFGEKDFQQLQIIRHLVKSKKIPLEIRPVEIVREGDGLAMSSRNLRLTPEWRKEAPFLYHILREAREMAQQGHSPGEIKRYVMQQFEKETALRPDYFEIAEEETLQPADTFEPDKHYRAFVAAYAGDIRLIDNIRIK